MLQDGIADRSLVHVLAVIRLLLSIDEVCVRDVNILPTVTHSAMMYLCQDGGERCCGSANADSSCKCS